MTKPDSTTYLEPASSRSIQEWTPQLIKAARASADAGNLSLAADFCEAAMADDRVSAAVSTRTNGLVALPLNFEAVRGTKRLVKALEAGEDWWAAYPATALAQLLAWGRLLGVGLAQNVWTDRGSSINRLVPVLKVWHPRHLRFDTQNRKWKLRVGDGGKEIEITPGDGTWILYMPYGDSRPWASGAWRAIAIWHLLKTYAIEDWGHYSAKNAGGHLVAEAPEGKDSGKEKRKELAADLFAMQANSAIALPPGFKLSLIESTANTWETFKAQKDAADMGMSVALLGQNLSTEVSGPVSTGATLHGRVLQVFIDADAETLSTCIREQSLTWWAEFNFGQRDLAPWPAWDTKPPEDRAAVATVAKLKADTGKTLASIGVATVDEVRVAAGLEPIGKDKGGEELVKLAPAATPKPADEGDEEDGKKTLDVRDSDPIGFVRLRSGRLVRAASGLVEGQIYADAVADAARDRAAKVLDEDLVAVLEAIDGGESYDDIRARLVKTYRGMSAEKLAKLTEAAITMAELGGRHAMNEDT